MLIAELSQLDYESFMETDAGLLAYIQADVFTERGIADLPKQIGGSDIKYAWTTIKEKNWNEEWEKDYPLVIVDGKCAIKAPFHKEIQPYPYEIIIEPKMSFGTGHHETTSLMVSMMLEFNFENKSVADVGCGTGVLAILASKLKANKVFAVDIDTWAYENTVENIIRNNCKNIETLQGGFEVLPNMEFDVILANINRNVLIENMDKYASALSHNGHLFISGIYQVDIDGVVKVANKNKLLYKGHKEKNNWTAARFTNESI